MSGGIRRSNKTGGQKEDAMLMFITGVFIGMVLGFTTMALLVTGKN
ncbi:MAG: hypothetical protein HZA16_14810 [Nitrospirae bacterium]|nr:hypothetical protein [Nitrospirota bacterium]